MKRQIKFKTNKIRKNKQLITGTELLSRIKKLMLRKLMNNTLMMSLEVNNVCNK
ncbi:hypothetical protein N184_32715 [Sinorhizobium sp. GL28]|nr:hypothetical protein N184_32715 [Sinorhizobium sp. GL28]